VVRPNGVDLDAFAFGDHAAPAGRTLLMTGDFGYLPNVDAARWLTGEIFPAVRRQLPAATLRLVGRSAPTAGLPDGASGTPDVPHIAPYFDDADLFIVPLRAGGGTRLKIVEALAKGLPTVTTSIGAEGLAVQDGEHLLIADTTSSLVEAVTRLLADVDLRRRLARNGRELVERRYGWETIAAAYAADLRALVGGRST
jgi:glycosyltransferase involved in cell wall biosynthesis